MSLLSLKKNCDFYDDWESRSHEFRQDHISSCLNDFIRYASEHVPFYRDRLSSFDINAEHPLADVTPMTPTRFREMLPPHGNELICTDNSGYTVFQSGGTTGMPKTTLFSHEELEMLNLPNARGFYGVGLKATDRVANLFAVGGLYMTFIHINRMLQQYGCMNFPFSNHTPSDFIHTIVRLFHVNAFAGITSIVLTCLREMADLSSEPLRIEKVYTGGEHIYEADKKDIKKKFGSEIIAAPGYGTVDTWYLGYQCLDCPTGTFHAHDDQVYLEIIDEETGRHCNRGEAGMLLATPFVRRLTPVVRYRVGDLALWTGETCSCGRTTPLFRLLGRGDDILRIGFDSIDYNFVQDTAATIEGLSGSIQIVKKRMEGRDRLKIRIETEADPSTWEGLSLAFKDRFLTGRPSLREFIEKGTVWPLDIELVKPGTLERNTRTGKLKRVIDAF